MRFTLKQKKFIYDVVYDDERYQLVEVWNEDNNQARYIVYKEIPDGLRDVSENGVANTIINLFEEEQ